MNLSVVALALIAWQMLSNGKNGGSSKSEKQAPRLSDFLSQDTKDILNCAQKLTDDSPDKMATLLEMLSNPAVMNLAQNFFGGSKQQQSETENNTQNTDSDAFCNSEGYNFDKPSQDSREFFRPIDNIADAEVKHKLYWFYDNWYL